jgi:hypothetical protein
MWTMLTTAISIATLLFGALLIQPRLNERRIKIDERYILTSTEVSQLPANTLAVVLDRRQGMNQNDFQYKLLKLVLERSGKPHVLGLSETIQPQDEAIAALAQGERDPLRNPQRLSVGVYGAGTNLNQRLRAVPIPVAGGILGLRAGWSHRHEQPALKAIKTAEELRRIVLLQGLGWSDVKIFDASGLRTYTARSEDLFRLVDNRRVQLFPRGITELESEHPVVRSSTKDTSLDPHLLLAYPFAGFFYVGPNNQALAEAIHTGFERAIADGSYQHLLEQKLLTPWLKQALQLADRRVIVLSNPDAALALAEVNPRHWLVPWPELLKGSITSGAQLCERENFQALCEP